MFLECNQAKMELSHPWFSTYRCNELSEERLESNIGNKSDLRIN